MKISSLLEKWFELKRHHKVSISKDGTVTKRFRRSVFGPLEMVAGRKSQSPIQRFGTELRKGESCKVRGINCPRIVSINHRDKAITYEFLDGVDLREAYKELDESSKRLVFGKTLNLLRVMHESGISHGDPKVRNFMQVNGEIYTLDLEEEWLTNPFRRDLITLTADTIVHNSGDLSYLSQVKQDYGNFSRVPFSRMETFYYRKGFSVPQEFLDFFSN